MANVILMKQLINFKKNKHIMKTHTKQFALIFALIALVTVSCKKDATSPTPEPEPAPANGTAMLHLHTNVDTIEVDDYDSIYVMADGRKISVSIAQLYISNIQLVKADGSTFDVSGLTIAKTQPVEEYMLGSVPVGNYKSIRFNVGLSPTVNTLLPLLSDSVFYKPNMWFGNTVQPWNGYVFVNFQGKIDTTNAANGTIAGMQPFSYRIGSDAHLKSVSMPDQNYTISSGQTQYIHIMIDYGKLFNGIALNSSVNLNVTTSGDNSGALSNQIANNIPSMFIYQ
jgi:hypothetical protein